MILIVQGDQFQVNQFGMPIDAGVFAIQNDVLVTQSRFTGVAERFGFSLQPDVLRLQDAWGALYVYQRLQ